MNSPKNLPAKSVADHRRALIDQRETEAALKRSLAAKKSKIIDLAGAADLKELSGRNPQAARDVLQLQSEISFDQLILDGLFDRGVESGAAVLFDSQRMLERISILSSQSIALVVAGVTKAIRGLGLFEEARLPRLVEEALQVRAERNFAHQFSNLNCGGGEAFNAGDGGAYYPHWHAEHVLAAHDKITAALEAVEAHAAEVRKRYAR